MGMIYIVPYQLFAHHVCALKLICRTAHRILFHAHFIFQKITTIFHAKTLSQNCCTTCVSPFSKLGIGIVKFERARALTAVGAALVCALSIACAKVHAQQQSGSAPSSFTDLSKYILSGNQVVPQQSAAPLANLSSTVTQVGQGNNASAVLNGTSNVTTQYQFGSQNSSVLSANGVQNTLTTTQIGNSNSTSISVEGNGNNISNLQVGSGLSYQLKVVGTAVPVSVQQFGRK
jgi:hypothetical protein